MTGFGAELPGYGLGLGTGALLALEKQFRAPILGSDLMRGDVAPSGAVQPDFRQIAAAFQHQHGDSRHFLPEGWQGAAEGGVIGEMGGTAADQATLSIKPGQASA